MKVEIVNQYRRKRHDISPGSILEDILHIMPGISPYEYVIDLRIGNFSYRYDDAIYEFLEYRHNLGNESDGRIYCSSQTGNNDIHDNASNAIMLRIVIRDSNIWCLKSLDMDANSFERKMVNCDLTPDDAKKILASAFCRARWTSVRNFRKYNDLYKALSGRMSADEELGKFGRPFTPVQAELCLALRKEVQSLEEKRKADVEALTLKASEAYYKTERREYEKKIDAVNAEYGRKTAELSREMDEIAAA